MRKPISGSTVFQRVRDENRPVLKPEKATRRLADSLSEKVRENRSGLIEFPVPVIPDSKYSSLLHAEFDGHTGCIRTTTNAGLLYPVQKILFTFPIADNRLTIGDPDISVR